ncbi:hypothetical protein PybrP1_011792 [[Pythium] brassicae (nom. inval.)]|nr:hypothetical protein PybrP1_011792 [[Pythium] brassicae (nom. inval.)]
MSRSRYVSPFPRFQLSGQEEADLHQLAGALVASSLAEFESFTEEYDRLGNGTIDSKDWKFVREREKLRAYTGRSKRFHKSASSSHPITSTTTNNNKDPGGPGSVGKGSTAPSRAASMIAGANQQNQHATDAMPVVLVVGAVQGSLDDMMYGIMNHSVDVARVKNSYVDDMETDLAVLAALVTPTPALPYESLTIKWAALEQKAVVRAVVKKRDFVYMEMTGMRTLARTGARVGYHMVHSLHFPQTPELESCVRANLSIAAFCRASPSVANEVQLCVRGVADPGGSMLRVAAVGNMAAGFTSLWRNVECANRKKLAWLMASTHSRSLSDGSGSGSGRESTLSAARADGAGTFCATCGKPPRVLAFSRGARRRRCGICTQYLCSSCRIKKTLSYIHAGTDALVRRDLAFCSACVLQARSLDSYKLAQHEAATSYDHFHADARVLAAGSSSGLSDQFQ